MATLLLPREREPSAPTAQCKANTTITITVKSHILNTVKSNINNTAITSIILRFLLLERSTAPLRRYHQRP